MIDWSPTQSLPWQLRSRLPDVVLGIFLFSLSLSPSALICPLAIHPNTATGQATSGGGGGGGSTTHFPIVSIHHRHHHHLLFGDVFCSFGGGFTNTHYYITGDGNYNKKAISAV